MNLANKLTLLRVILVPFFAFFMLAGDIVPYSYLWAAVIFAVASITDTADGKIARKYNMVTNFGKFLDPLADKVLVVTALICFVELGWASAWVTAIIVAREFVVSGIRLIAAGSEKKDGYCGKYMGQAENSIYNGCDMRYHNNAYSCRFRRCHCGNLPVQIISDILMYISCILTTVSGIKYLWDYREVLKTDA